MNEKKKHIYILIADMDDQFLTSSTLQESGIDASISFYQDPAELFDAIKKQVPSLVILDQNLSPEPGLDILKRVRSSEHYSAIPVVILTDSPLWHHHALCYKNGASTVIRKPGSIEMTRFKITTFFEYWLKVAETQN